MNNYPYWQAKKQVRGDINKGKWAVYRPDGIRYIVCESRGQAEQLAYMLRVATTANGGDWHSLLAQTVSPLAKK